MNQQPPPPIPSQTHPDAFVAPEPNTLLWYRLACFLPRSLPTGANISTDPADVALAAEDYAKVIADLGRCPRTRH